MADSKIRWSESTEPETPPSARVYMWYDETEKVFKLKKDDGSVETLGSGGTASPFQKKLITADTTVPDGYTWIRAETILAPGVEITLQGDATLKMI